MPAVHWVSTVPAVRVVMAAGAPVSEEVDGGAGGPAAVLLGEVLRDYSGAGQAGLLLAGERLLR